MSRIAEAKRILNHYIRKAWEASGLSWDYDNEAEVDGIIEDIVCGIKAELSNQNTDSAVATEATMTCFDSNKPHLYTASDGIKRNGCPKCFEENGKNEILYVGQKFCSVCGCRIDWSDRQ